MDILLVEDNEGDVRLLREALAEVNQTARLHVVGDGLEALAFLRYQGQYLDAPRPNVILLDLHMPRMGGIEVLAQIKGDPWFKTIPIIVLTSSPSEMHIAKCYGLMANCYLVKPQEWKEFEGLIKSLNDFWLTEVTFHEVGQPPAPPLNG